MPQSDQKHRDREEAKALYYPYVRFSDEGWLKRAALLWDQMGRIVPDEAHGEDSDTVKELRDAAGFIVDERPYEASMRLGEVFLPLLREHGEDWRTRYDVTTVVGSPPYSPGVRRGFPVTTYRQEALDPWQEAGFAGVYSGKLCPDVREVLIASGLARPSADHEMLYMRSELADLYMTALASVMAGEQYQPVTDRPRHHWLAGRPVEELAHVVLGGGRGKYKRRLRQAASPAEQARQTQAEVALYAVRMALPADTASLSVPQIIRFRNAHRDEVRQFRADVAAFVEESELIRTAVGDPDRVQELLQHEYQRRVAKRLDGLDRFFGKLGKATVWSTLFVSPCAAVVRGLPDVGLALDPIPEYVGALALSLIPVIQAKRKEAHERVGASLYLLHAAENFGLQTKRVRSRRYGRHFFFRV